MRSAKKPTAVNAPTASTTAHNSSFNSPAMKSRHTWRPARRQSEAWGRFVLRAYSISDTPQAVEASIAVRIQRQEPTLLKFVDALSSLGLSPKQREVALGLAKGSSNREIAAAMGVSLNTVAYHIKQLFQRLDTHDRQQVIAKILLDGVQSL